MGYKILQKRYLNPEKSNFEIVVEAPEIALKAKGGNFVGLRLDETGERFPLTIADYDREAGTITMVVAIIGKSTMQLGLLEEGDEIMDFIGPLGLPAHLEKTEDPIIAVGGGVGIAAIYPQVKELKQMGAYVIAILGARTKGLIFWEEKFRKIADEVIVTTDDGSLGDKGVVTVPLKKIIKERKIAKVIAIGPLIMMKFVTLTTKGNPEENVPHVPTTVSLNTMMVDMTGMCGGCRFSTLDGQMKFACVDGPDVDGHNVDFNNLLQRNSRYKSIEQERHEKFSDHCRAVMKFNQEKGE